VWRGRAAIRSTGPRAARPHLRIGCNPHREDGQTDGCTPVNPNYNATILGHAYYLFAREVGWIKAGRVLQFIPWFLDPQPRFVDVKSGFNTRSAQLYPYDDPGDPDLSGGRRGLRTRLRRRRPDRALPHARVLMRAAQTDSRRRAVKRRDPNGVGVGPARP
jgi:hypothetical protein